MLVTNQLSQLLDALGGIILGKSETLRLAVICLLARGHLLLEDIPGVGKTTLAHALAASLGLPFRRLQFTSDLLPGDILGSSIFDVQAKGFVFHPGPVFANILLVDEVNRATPRTQSALLEAMEERQVSVDGSTHALPEPFFVVATQNPLSQVGTYSLPESQLDRFLMRLSLGFPDRASERVMLLGQDRRELVETLSPILSPEALKSMQNAVGQVHCGDEVLNYLQDLLEASRKAFAPGLSPRAGLAWLRAGRASALLAGRDFVIPEDLQLTGQGVMAHRLGQATEGGSAERAEQVLSMVPSA
ncbi:MAG: AAA family ATPase [Verrucomicrobiales bacterium]